MSFLFVTEMTKAEDKIDVAAVLDSLHTAASNAQATTYFGLFTDDAIFIGTDVNEYWTLDEFKSYTLPYFNQGQGWTYTPRSRDIRFSDSGKVAWFHEVLDSESFGTTRGTGVLVLEEDTGWLIAQYHLTIPIPNEIANEVTVRIKKHEASNEAGSDQPQLEE